MSSKLMPEITNVISNELSISKESFVTEKEYIKQCQEGVLFDGKRIKVAEPKVSFLIPVYNKAKYLPLALRSAQNQSLRDIEIVCLDDGSTDNSVEVVEKFQKDDPRIVLFKHEKNMGTLTARAHLGKYAKGKYIMWLDPDDAYCSPNTAKMAYEKAEKTSTDIVHFKYLHGKFDGVSVCTEKAPTVYGIMKQPQLSDAICNKKKNLAVNTVAMWNKLYTKTTYLAAISFLGEKRYKEHIYYAEDLLLSFAIFSVAKSYVGLDHVAYIYKKNQDSVTYNTYTIRNGSFLDVKKSNRGILDLINICKFIFELCQNTPKGKAVAVRIFKRRSFPQDSIKKAIAISDHLDKFKELIKMFLDCKYVSKNDKKYIKKYLDDVLKLVPKKGKK